MTVSSTTARKTFTGDGATTSFATSPMVFFAAADLTVYVVTTATGAATTLTLNTHYTVSGGSGSTGTVSLAGGSSPYGAPSAAQTVVIVRELDRVQEVDFVDNEASDAEVQEDALDKLTMMIQEVDARVARSITLADSDVSSATATLPTPEASSLIGWNSAGTALQNYAGGDIDPDILVSTFMETVLDDTTAAAARTTLDAAQLTASMTAETSVNLGADYLSAYDASAAAERKVMVADAVPIRNVSGKVTTTSGTANPTASVTGATTIYYTPHNGNVVPIYDGTRFVPTVFAELSNATAQSSTGKAGPAAVGNNSSYDLFVWNDAGTVRLTRGPAWSSDTARGTGAGTTELEVVQGIRVNKVDITNGPAAQRGTYVGTFISNGSAQIDDTLENDIQTGPAVLGFWSAYNRARTVARLRDSADSGTYQSTTWRQHLGNTNAKITFVCGLAEDAIDSEYLQFIGNSATDYGQISIGLDSTNSSAGWVGRIVVPTNLVASANYGAVNTRTDPPQLGKRYLAPLEVCVGTTAPVTFYGDAGGANYLFQFHVAVWR